MTPETLDRWHQSYRRLQSDPEAEARADAHVASVLRSLTDQDLETARTRWTTLGVTHDEIMFLYDAIMAAAERRREAHEATDTPS